MHTADRAEAPLVSVVIPTFNRPHLVVEAVESVLHQSHANLEVIVVDDGSQTDTESAICDRFSDPRVRFYRQENAGQAAARNRGAKAARGEFIGFLDDDDLWFPENVAHHLAAFRRCPQSVISCAYQKHFSELELDWQRDSAIDDTISAAHRLPAGDCHLRLLIAGWVRTPGQILMRADSFDRVGGFDVNLKGTEDWDLLIRLAERGSFVVSEHVAVHYRIHSGTVSSRVFEMYREVRKVQRKHWTPRMKMRHPIHYLRARTSQIRRLQVAFQNALQHCLDRGDSIRFETLVTEARKKHPYLLLFPSFKRSRMSAVEMAD